MVVAMVGGRNPEHTRFVSYVGSSPASQVHGQVLKNFSSHFKPFWQKLRRHFDRARANVSQPMSHLLIYRSAASGDAQHNLLLEYEVAKIEEIIQSDLGKFSYYAEENLLHIEHAIFDLFTNASFDVFCHLMHRGAAMTTAEGGKLGPYSGGERPEERRGGTETRDKGEVERKRIRGSIIGPKTLRIDFERDSGLPGYGPDLTLPYVVVVDVEASTANLKVRVSGPHSRVCL